MKLSIDGARVVITAGASGICRQVAELFIQHDANIFIGDADEYRLSDMDTSQQHYELLLEKVARGELGAKSGSGFYDWNASFAKKWRARMFQNLVDLRRRDIRQSGE